MTATIPPLRGLPAPPLPSLAASPPPARPEPPPSQASGPNPSLRIEPALGIVVFEVLNDAGDVVRSVPTERELRDYRAAALRGTPEGQTLNPPAGNPSSASPGGSAEPTPDGAAAARATR
ncbi:MAG: hypothetical protein MUF65_01360 [Rubritepida sp.]|nr:hypothetical protein [Rubritepida sp.]MCU0944000.1 hypothetical protein [Rubritepida sp.]